MPTPFGEIYNRADTRRVGLIERAIDQEFPDAETQIMGVYGDRLKRVVRPPRAGIDPRASWIADSIIDRFLQLLVAHQRQHTNLSVYHVPTIVLQSYTARAQQVPFLPNGGHVYGMAGDLFDHIAGLVEHQLGIHVLNDLRQVDVVLLPIMANNHWSLVAIYPNLRKMYFANSKPGRARVDVQWAMVFLRLIFGDQLQFEKWRISDVAAVQQKNLSDCGVYLLLNAMQMIREPLLEFEGFCNIADAGRARRYITECILQGRILGLEEPAPTPSPTPEHEGPGEPFGIVEVIEISD